MGALAFVCWWESDKAHTPQARSMRLHLISRATLLTRYELSRQRQRS